MTRSTSNENRPWPAPSSLLPIAEMGLRPEPEGGEDLVEVTAFLGRGLAGLWSRRVRRGAVQESAQRLGGRDVLASGSLAQQANMAFGEPHRQQVFPGVGRRTAASHGVMLYTTLEDNSRERKGPK